MIIYSFSTVAMQQEFTVQQFRQWRAANRSKVKMIRNLWVGIPILSGLITLIMFKIYQADDWHIVLVILLALFPAWFTLSSNFLRRAITLPRDLHNIDSFLELAHNR